MPQYLLWLALAVIALEIVFVAVIAPSYLPAWAGAVGTLSYGYAVRRSRR